MKKKAILSANLFRPVTVAPKNASETAAFEVYEHLRDSEYNVADRRYVNRMWKRFQDLALGDPTFFERFPYECPSRVWELYLAFVFDRWGWPLRPSAKPGAGPDFGIACEGGSMMWIEAVAPMPVGVPEGEKQVWGGQIEDPIALRYLTAITEKRNKWTSWLSSKLVSASDGFVIALSGSKINWASADGRQPPRIVRLLYGLGEDYYTVAIGGTGGVTGHGIRPRFSISKASGAPVSTNLFGEGTAPEISAVLFDPHHIKNRPKRPGAHFILVQNLCANVRFPRHVMRAGVEWGPELVRHPPRRRRRAS